MGSFLRFHELAAVPPGLSPDEAMEGSNALEALETRNFQVFYPENNGREGLYANAAAAAIGVFGNTKLALRLPAALCGTLTVAGLYLLVAELFPIPIALLGSFFLATSFWHIVASRIAGHAIMAPLFLVWTLYFLVRAILRLGQPGMLINSLIAGMFLGLGFHSYAPFRIAPLLIGPILIAVFLQARSSGRSRSFGLLLFGYISAATLVCVPLVLYFVRVPEMFWNRANQVSVFNSIHPAQRVVLNILNTAQMFFYQGDKNWRHNYSGDRELFWPVALCFALGCFLAVRELLAGVRDARQHPVDIRIWLRGMAGIAWLLVGAIPVVLSDEGLPHALRSLVFAPAVFVLAAWGAVHAYSWAKLKAPRHLLLGATSILLAVLCVQPYNLYFNSWATRPEVATANLAFAENMADAIGRLPNQTEKYVVLCTQALPVRGIPLIAQSIMYLTDSFTSRGQAEHHIYYVTRQNAGSLGGNDEPGNNLCDRVNTAHPYAETFCIP
jgi:4-amino-4-deoxy-L-arabinose transferase-like glycosyltransferase